MGPAFEWIVRARVGGIARVHRVGTQVCINVAHPGGDGALRHPGWEAVTRH